jgi:uncharacterized protein YcbK (DUF882 family)
VSEITLSRRKFLFLATSFVAVTATPGLATSVLSKKRPRFTSRHLCLYNLHTGEEFEGIYWREGEYVKKARERLDYLLRDRRDGQQHKIDARLFDVLHRLQSTLGTEDPYQVICGYRSKTTNDKLHKTRKGVAKNSLHVQGKAIDVRLEHIALKDLSNAARSLKAGGVGYYPKSNFIHVDIRPKPTFWS